jgi:hypothetical protein
MGGRGAFGTCLHSRRWRAPRGPSVGLGLVHRPWFRDLASRDLCEARRARHLATPHSPSAAVGGHGAQRRAIGRRSRMNLGRPQAETPSALDVAPLARGRFGNVVFPAGRRPVEAERRRVVDRLALGAMVDAGERSHEASVARRCLGASSSRTATAWVTTRMVPGQGS